ncbi:MAG TPA: hypothetical protein VFS43_23125 [Polyangiaceae bacterium]|nr:hypothetical protein [Polyangiaceae bacterium]
MQHRTQKPTRRPLRSLLAPLALVAACAPPGDASDAPDEGVREEALTACLAVSPTGTRTRNTSFAAQSAPFVAEWSVVPGAASVDGAVALSNGAQTAWAGFAATVRFNAAGQIDARNGAVYAAAAPLAYAAGQTYHVKMVVDPAAQRYSAFVTPPGGSPVKVADNYAFRVSTTTLNNAVVHVGYESTGTLSACDFVVGPVSAPAPSPAPAPAPAPGEVLAFPGAEGFGAKSTTGGRGGKVFKVTNLNATGTGSLQWAVSQPGKRTVVFAVSGVIKGDIHIPHGDLTIAGQTAPGGGITIAGKVSAAYDVSFRNVVMRFVRVRPPALTGSQGDALQFSRGGSFVFDHVSIGWGCDETLDLYEATDVTLQWSSIEEAATNCGHPDGSNHNYGMINGPDGRRVAVHHSLFAHNLNRNPAIANGPAEVRNNVVYNVKHGFIHHNPASGAFDIVGNYFKQGPSASLMPFFFDDENGFADAGLKYYLRDNYVDDPGDLVGPIDNPWATPYAHPTFANLLAPTSKRAAAEFDFSSIAGFKRITTQSSTEAYDLVAARAGAFPRDVVTRRAVDELKARTGAFGRRVPADLMNGLTATAAPADKDNDGMADAWEASKGLDPANGADHVKLMPSGYTAIEEYINGLAAQLVP